jgi:hypothetical protein
MSPNVRNASLLWQIAFRQEANGITKTILVSGPRIDNLAGPKVEIHAFAGRFVERQEIGP